MNSLRIRLFGNISIEQDGRVLSELPAKAVELLCYLFLYRDRAHSREALAALLWPDGSHALSKKYLRQTLWRLQSMLGTAVDGESEDKHAWLILNPGWARIDPEFSWWSDVDEFERAYALSRDTPSLSLTDQQAQSLKLATDLYQGDLMELWYQDWCIYERERLQLTYLVMLEKLMGYCEAHQLYTKGVAYGQDILRYDQARESTHQQLMQLYYLSGDRTDALRQYDRCAAALKREFNLSPSRETVDLYEQIRLDQLVEIDGSPDLAKRRTNDRPETDLLHDLYRQLGQIQASLSSVQRQVQHELAALKDQGHGDQKTPKQTPRETR